ncbi:MAG: hypothetical protein WBO12_17735 [Xanthobacteraceae bacterium]
MAENPPGSDLYGGQWLLPLPPPWSVEESDACIIVRDHNGPALA